MTRVEVVARIREIGLVPVVRAQSADEALALSRAIAEGGVPVLEITLTVPGAVDVIRRVVAEGGDAMLVGAGTVLTADDAAAAVDAGARFIVSPGFDAATVEWCRFHDVAVLPGALTPTEVIQAWRAGADFVKVFPCGAVGGAAYLKALKAPLPQIDLVPTGGVTLASAEDLIRAGAAALGVGADLCDVAAIRRGDAAKVTSTARSYRAAIEKARDPGRV
jgi:2-dehydro-3-deoxyphosphogluconate aldolase / (4S)-4-hydroxy-2-oxoglutarate aldolase